MVLGVQEECSKTMECLSVNYKRKPFGSEEEAGDVGEAVEVVEKNIDSQSRYACCGYGIQKGAIAGCRESWGWGRSWDCWRGPRGLLLEEYTRKKNVLQMSLVLVGSDRVAETKGY